MSFRNNEHSRALPVRDDMTDIRDLVCAEGDISREHRIVENCEQEETAKFYIHL